jgi:sigma-B regulation protein RsbU (phosphoserine phosphatase)
VVLPDGSVSRHHAVIRRHGETFFIEDVSARGVTVNGVRTAGATPFAYGDAIRFGGCVATVLAEPELLSGAAEDTGSHRIGSLPIESIAAGLEDPVGLSLGHETLRRSRPNAFARLETADLQRQLTTARAIQKTLLPSGHAVFPGYRFFGESQPCYAVGGDFFDFIDLEGGRTGLVLGDVSGKGLGAALLAHFTQAAIRTAMRYERDVARVVAGVNRELYERSLPNQFVTACVGVFDPTSGRLQDVNAGHCPPLYVKRGSEPRFLTDGSMTLGILSDSPYRTNAIELEPGSAIVLYTDGFTECTNGDDIEFGPERLATFFGPRAASLPESILEDLEVHLEQFGVRGMQTDDMTILLLQREA